MKLYAFEFINGKIIRQEVEAHETPKCYMADEKVNVLYSKRISKGYVGTASVNSLSHPHIILLEDDLEKAKQSIIDGYNSRIAGLNKAILELEQNIENIKKSSL